MRKRKLRRKCKKSTPPSSGLFYLTTNYKIWYTDFIHGNLHSFCTAYFRFHVLHKLTCKKYCKNIKSKQYSVSDTKLLKSGDIEMNPGPIENISPQNNMLLATRLQRYGLRPLDFGGSGDCFFELSHTSYMMIISKFHLNVRALGVRYLREHPERFIESNTENSWKESIGCLQSILLFIFEIAQLTSLGITNSIAFFLKNEVSWAILNMNKRKV